MEAAIDEKGYPVAIKPSDGCAFQNVAPIEGLHDRKA